MSPAIHPRLGVPGPRYAVLSRWHERYYDIEEQHRKYGATVFTKAGRVDKYDWLSSRFGNDTSVLTSAPDSLHRIRRGALNPLFSRPRILGLQDAIRSKLNILIKRLENAKAVQAPAEIQRGFGALSEDVIMRYSFEHDYDSLNKEWWAPILHDSLVGVSILGNTALHFPLLPRVMNALPESWIGRLGPLYGLIFRMQKDFGQQIREAKASIASRSETKEKESTVFLELIEGDLPDAEKPDRRLRDEAQLVIAAGLATTAWALIFARLRLELDEAIPSYDPANPTANLKWTQLEKLPYLTAVIKEAVHLSYSTTSRNVRLLPKPFQFSEWTIPARTPDIFPNSKSFVPERWLESGKTKNGSPLERYFVGFGKGTRSCLGLNLAWCEMYLVSASLFRFFDLELYETDVTDVEFAHDFFIPFPRLDSKGVRVFVKPRK
ncbi:cytochrome P450 [Aspergillus heterothallicus]